jgi:hypothetical protein
LRLRDANQSPQAEDLRLRDLPAYRAAAQAGGYNIYKISTSDFG